MENSQPKNIWIIDTTLRDGEQSPGVYFKARARVDLAKMLAGAGVHELEAGIPAMGETARNDLRNIIRLGLDCRITGWCRADITDIELAEQCGLNSVQISFPVSKRQLNSFGKKEAWVLKSIEEIMPCMR